MNGTRLSIGFLLLVTTLAACSQTPEPPPPAPDIGAAVQTAVAEAVPSPTPPPTPDVGSAVQTAVAEAIPSPAPSPTPDLDATVRAGVRATVAARPTPTPFPTPTPAPTVTPVPTATAIPTPTPFSIPTPTPAPPRQWTPDNPATLQEIEAALKSHRGESLTFATWGGAYEAAQAQAYMAPFQDQFGVEIVTDTMNYAKVRAQVDSGNLQWHVLDYGGQAAWQAAANGYLEELDFSIIDTRDFLEGGKSPYFGGGGITWSNVMAYSLESVDDKWDGRHPQTMADVFDWDKFPGERSLASPEWSWKTSLRFALLSRHAELL